MSEHPESVARRASMRAGGDPAHLMDVAALRQFVGAPVAVALLEDAADRAVGATRPLEDTLLLGPDDSGKQLVARALARDAAQRAVEGHDLIRAVNSSRPGAPGHRGLDIEHRRGRRHRSGVME